MTAPALYIDLDGTLIATDLLHESLLQLVRASPLSLFMVPVWLARGRAFLKQEVARRVEIDVTTLPYREDVLRLVREARKAGRRVVLATASDMKFARQIASHLGLFDDVIASSGGCNMSGVGKLEAIERHAGGLPFAYAGDRPVDVSIWQRAQAAVVVSDSDWLHRRAAQSTAIEAVIRPPAARLSRYIYGMRLHQWLKNLLVFLPLLPSLHALTLDVVFNAAIAFLAFGLMASGIYVVNDLLDLGSDRRHHRKRRRPFAAGEISVSRGLLMAFVLSALSLALSLAMLPVEFAYVLLAYMALTTAYSVHLKRRAVVDVFSLAALYTIRIAAGTAATGLPFSFWVLSFSLFIFLSLALAKRYVELVSAVEDPSKLNTDRGYLPGDLNFVLACGVSAGQTSALLLGLYINDQDMMGRYNNPVWLWMLIPVVLFWTVRIWLKAVRGLLHEDPIVFAARDWVSLTAVGVGAFLLWMAG